MRAVLAASVIFYTQSVSDLLHHLRETLQKKASLCKFSFFPWRLLILKAQVGFPLGDFFENIPDIYINSSSSGCIANSCPYLFPQILAFEFAVSLGLIQGLEQPSTSQCAAYDPVTHSLGATLLPSQLKGYSFQSCLPT